MILWLIKVFYERKEENKLRHRKFASLQYSKVFNSSLVEEEFDVLLNQSRKQIQKQFGLEGNSEIGSTSRVYGVSR